MHPSSRAQRLAFAMFTLACIAAFVLAGVSVLGMRLTPLTALCAAGVSALLFSGFAYLHDAHRAARWDAGYRVR